MNSKEPKSESTKRVDKIFKDLQEVKKLVNGDHYLVPGDTFESQKLFINKRKWIKYPEKRLEKKHLSDDAIRWALLHEEGHLSEHKGHHYFAYGAITYIMFCVIYFILPSISGIAFQEKIKSFLYFFDIFSICFIYPILFFIVMTLLTYILLKKTEFDCDRTAAKKMKSTYGAKNPSLLAQESYDWLKDTAEEKEELKGLRKLKQKFEKLLKDCFDPHPPWCERIEKLKGLDEDT